MDENQYYWEMVKKNIGVYSREEQERLRNAKVIIFGLGGVGGYEVILCARMGLGHITGVDPDEFEVSNINRQMLSFVSRIGSNKAETAAELLQDINPSINIRVTQDFVTEQNAIDLLSNTDVIVDTTDDLVARVIIHRAAATLGIPSIWIAVTPPFRGGVMSLTPDSVPYEIALGYPSYQQQLTDNVKQRIHSMKDGRALYSISQGADEQWAQNYVKKESPWAVLSPVANIVGILASFEAFKLIVRRSSLLPILSPQLIRIDLAHNEMVTVMNPQNGSWNYSEL